MQLTHSPKGDGIARGRLRRTAPLVGLTARTAGEAVVVGLRSKLTGADSTEFHVRTAERYAELLGRSKGALMKAGQMLSFVSAGPAVPAEFQSIYQAALTRLRDEAPPMAPELARAVLERELGRRTESAFARVRLGADGGGLDRPGARRAAARRPRGGGEDPVPRGGRRDRGRPEEHRAAGHVSRACDPACRRGRCSFDLRGAAREMGERITEELDYRLEAANQAEFAEHLPRAPVHPRAGGDRRAVHRSRADPGARAGQILERGPHAPDRSCASSGRRRSTASSMAPTAASACSTPTRIPATTSSTTTAA